MKEKINRLILLVCLAFACVIGFAACNLVTAVDFKLQFIVDGEIYATIDTAGEETIRLPNDPEKNGYIFDGWYWDENTWERPFTADSLLNEKLTSDMSVYAKWKDEEAIIREFTVTFNSMGGSSVESKTVKDGDLLTEPAEPKYNGYIFNGWYKDEACTQSWVFESDKITASITLYAGWVEETATTFTVTYIDGAETLYTKKVVENGKAENINISKEGHTFKGWLLDGTAFDFATPITENITLTANWEIKTYTVTFIADSEQVEQFEVDYLGSVPKIPEVPAKIGYAGTWNITDFTYITKELTVTAVYTAKNYTATLDYAGANTGNSLQSITLTYGQPIGSLPTPGKTDCTFSGWFYEGTQITASTIWQNDISTEITFTAKWIVADNGHAIVSSDYFTFIDETTLTQDGTLRNAVDTYDLRGKFTVSAGASWRAFTNKECVPTSEITTRIASVAPGWNDVYILVENNTTYAQTVYKLRIYRNRILQVPVNYNETVRYDTVKFEENVTAGETENAVFPAFTVENYSCDGKYYSDARYTTEWTDDVFVTEATAIYIQAYCHDVKVNGSTVTGMNQQQGKVHLVIPETLNGKTLTTIQAESFLNVENIVFVTLPDSIVSIGIDAFKGTNFYAKTENWEDGVLYAGKHLLVVSADVSGSFEVKEDTICIAEKAFEACEELTSITLPFVGASKNGTSNIHFGYIFGASSYSYNDEHVPSSLRTVIITGGTSIGEYAFYKCSNLMNTAIPDSVTSIGDSAFYGCSSLTSITIPDSVTSIGDYAFYGCSSLTNITIGNSVASIGSNVFYGCPIETATIPAIAAKAINNSKLKTVVIEGGTSIEDYAFENCSSLTSITIPNSLTSIGSYVFSGCDSLNAVYITDIESWCEIVFENELANPLSCGANLFINNLLISELIIPENVMSIGNFAFRGCNSLTSITIPEGVTSIGDSAFSVCSGVPSIIIPESVTSIGDDAFYGCSSLTSITIGNGVTSIGRDAFRGCCSLTKVMIGNSVTNIGYDAFDGCPIETATIPAIAAKAINNSKLKTVFIEGGTSIEDYAFYDCSSLTNITIGNGVTSIGNSAFNGCSSLTNLTIGNSVTNIGYEAFSGCSSLTSITIPDSVTSIAWNAFYGCSIETATVPAIAIAPITNSKLKTVVITGGTSIGSNAFSGCSSLTSITISESVTSIGDSAFSGCSGVTSIIIPDGVTSIGNFAFSGCSSLTSITIPESVTSIGNSAFSSCSCLTIYCEKASKPSGWNSSWNSSCPVVWDCKNNEVASDGYIYAIVNNIRYALKEGAATVTNQLVSLSGDIVIPTSVEYKGIIYFITSIGDSAFEGCSGLMSVSFDKNSQLTSIRDSAFYGCNGLTSIEIPSGVTDIAYNSFYDCENLENIYYLGTLADWCSIIDLGAILSDTSNGVRFYIDGIEIKGDIVIPEGVTYIGVSTFEKCDKITSIKIPSTVEIIYNSAFKGCSSLERVIFEENSRLKIIAAYVFEDTKVKSINIPRSVTTIYGGWYDSDVLESVYIDDLTAWFSISFIETHSNPLDYADNFYCNDKLVSGELVIPADVTKIKANVLGRYNKINKIVIPESVTSIEDQAFSGCSGLSVIEVDPNNQYYCSEDGILYNKNKTEIICYPSAKNGEQFVIPDNVTNIRGGAFYGCNSLIKVVISGGVTTIGDYAFYGCSNLTEIEIPSSVKNIGDKAFYGCGSIVSVVIPNSVTGIGEGAFEECNSLESITIPFIGESRYATNNTHFGYIFGAYSYSSNGNFVPDSLHTVIITDCVKIASYALYGCNMLTDITIPDSVTSIGKYAFEKCSSLENFTVPAFAVSYLPKENLVDVVITSGEAIEANAFKGSNRLISITIADSVVDIGNQAFEGCTSIENAVIPAMIISYIPKDNLETVVITSGEEIPAYAFENCSSLTSIVISDSVTSIGYRAFYNCSGLTNIEIPASVTSIGSSAFEGCSNLLSVYITDIAAWCNISFAGSWEEGYSNPLYYAKDLYINSIKTTSLEIPNTVSSIGAYAFINCEALAAVQIPNSVTSIGRYAFKGTRLEKVYIDDLAAWCKISFEDYTSNPLCSETAALYLNGILVTDIQIPENVTEIKNYTFLNCSSLTSVKIHNKVTSIGQDAFSSCVGLKDIEIPNGVTIIGVDAFWGCNELESVTIGNNVKTIGFMAFAYCESITTINIPNSLTSIEGDAFVRCMSLTAVYIEDLVSWCAISFADKYSNPLSYAKTLYLNGELVTDLNIPDSLTSISNYAFYNCSGLTTVLFGENSQLTSIGSYAFYNCSGLTSIEIPSSVTSIGDRAFGNCIGLTSIIVEEGNTQYHSSGNCLIETETKKIILGCQNSVIPNDGSVTSIGSYAFNNCSSLTSITIPDSVTSIGNYAFYGCSSLTNVTFENTSGWWLSSSSTATSGTSISESALADPSTAATYLTSTYYNYYWKRS